MTPKSKFLGTAAILAVSTAFGAGVVYAQATAETELGTSLDINVTGDLMPVNDQIQIGLTTAVTTGSNVSNINLGTGTETISPVLSNIDNLLSAQANGNESASNIILDFSPTTGADTAVAGNQQVLDAADGPTNAVSATAVDDTHLILVETPGTGVRTFSGTAEFGSNDISASANGNLATSQISIENGVDVAEDTSGVGGQGSAAIDETLTADPDNAVSGDLAVSSSQEIVTGTTSTISGTVENGLSAVVVEDLDSGTITVMNSDQTSSASGNTATSSIVSEGTTASITGTAAVSNLQNIDGEQVNVTSTTTGSILGASAGGEIADVTTPVGAVLDSTMTVSDNSQSSSATGNDSTQAITLNAANITGEGLAATSNDSDTGAGGVQLSAQGDAVIANVQRESGSVDVLAETSDNIIVSGSVDTTGNSTIEVGGDDAGNSQTASATGATTSNSLSLTSGATQSAAGVVASVQNAGGSVSVAAEATGNSTGAVSLGTVTDSSLLTTNNSIGSNATGGDATNSLSVTNGTNNLSVGANTGTTLVNDATGGAAQPDVIAGQVVTNDQSRGGPVTATSTDNQVVTFVDDDVTSTGTSEDADSSIVRTDDNSVSASATGQSADNGISLTFNNLSGDISTGAGTVASVANEQDMVDTSTVTATNVGADGEPVLTDISGSATDSNISTSNNTVSVTARGNVTTGNDVVANGNNIASGSRASPEIDAGNGEVNAGGAFVSASSQVSEADILATQNSDQTNSATSNTIETGIGENVTNSSLATDDNLLSTSATANTAANSVSLSGTTIDSSGTVANYQGTTDEGSVSATLGTVGTDPTAGTDPINLPPFTGTFEVDFTGGAPGDITLSGTGILTLGNGVTAEINTNNLSGTLNPAELELVQDELENVAGFSETSPGSGIFTATGDGTTTNDLGNFLGTGLDFDNDVSFTGLDLPGTAATPGTRNGAGVIARIDADGDGDGNISGSTVSVSGNTVVGEVTGNTATNAVSAEATDVTGRPDDVASVSPNDANVDPNISELATANMQVSESALSSDVAATFGIIDGGDGIDSISSSSQTLDGNLQQSFGTANRATNSVEVTATNTDAATALESSQLSNASVEITSDTQVVANAGGTNSSLDMTNNRNESVANGNVATNTVDITATNLDFTGTNQGDASASLTSVTAENVLASRQQVTLIGPDETISASADTDVFNEDVAATAEDIDSGSVTQSGNVSIAQATGNQAGNSLNLAGATDDDAANNDRTGALINVQSVGGDGATITANVDQSVRVELDQATIPAVNASSIAQDGNITSALARSNVATNTVTVDGANINSGTGNDANFDGGDRELTAAHILGSNQENTANVTATTDQSQVRLSSTNSDGNAIDSSTVSLSGNRSLTTALANSAVNTLSSGADAANVNASTVLGNAQDNDGSVQATGSSSVGVFAQSNSNPSDPDSINLSSVEVSDNVSSASAVGNQVENTLAASGTNINSGDPSLVGNASSGPIGAGNATVDASAGGVLVDANAGNLLMSEQFNGNTITATNTDNTVTINAQTQTTTTGAAASGSTLSVGGNAVEARATANLAINNSVNMGDMATASTGSTGIVGNFQDNLSAGTVRATASTDTTITLVGEGDAGALLNGTADVSGNSVLALGRGNVAQNMLNAEGSNVGTGSGNATVSAGLPATGILNASFGVFNEQVQQADVFATAEPSTISVNASSTTGNALNGASANVSGNSIEASAFGNVATNGLTLTSLNGGANNDATAAIFNGQTNSGNITAMATGASIGTFSTGGVTNASASVGGNSISANAVGNFSSSTVTRSNR